MTNLKTTILEKFKTWKEMRVKESKQPLSRENAYTLASIGKKGHYSDVLEDYKKNVLETIKEAARVGRNYITIEHPRYITPSDRKEIIQFMQNLNYSICFANDDIMVISWKFSWEDFNDKYDRLSK